MIKVKVMFPDNSLVRGAEISLFNRRANDEKRARWEGVSGNDGTCTWDDMDTGIVGRGGDVYEVSAKYLDRQNGAVWFGKKTARVKSDVTIPVNITESSLENLAELELDQKVMDHLSKSRDGKTVVEVLKELGFNVKNNFHHASIALISYTIEALIRLRLIENGQSLDGSSKEPLGALLKRAEVKELLGKDYLTEISSFNELRILAIHPKGANSILTDVRKGLGLMKAILMDWFR